MSTTTVSATNGSVAVGSIQVGGNVEGSIVVGHHNFVVNTNNGTIVYNAPAGPVIKRREVKPQPPRAPLDFFDRASELTQVEQLVRQGKPVAICGADGAGKSALLRQAANGTAAHTLPDGVILLEGLDEHGNTLLPGDVIQRWFDAFYLSAPHLKVTSASAQPYLSQLRPLLLLDHVTLDADQLRPLLDLFPNSPALIARPAALPGLARPIKLGALPRSDAMELFSATSGLLIDDANRSTCDAICALLNDVPLAIVRAADVIREMNLPLDQAQARLEAAPSAAGDNIAIGLSRAVTLIRSVLTLLEEQILEAAANLPGLSIDPQTMANIISGQPSAQAGGRIQIEDEWVIIDGVRLKRRDGAARSPSPSQGEGRGEGSVEAAIEHLKALGLLHANSPRVRMDAGLREFWSGDGNAIKDRLLAQLLIDQLNGRFGDDTFCANELGHVLGAIDHAVQTQQWTAATALSRAIDRYVTLHGLWDAWGQIADRVLQSARAVNDRSNEAWALHQLGTRAIASDKAQAIDLLKQALSVRQAIGETTAAAYTQHNLDVLIPPPAPPREKPQPARPGPAPAAGGSPITKLLIVVGILLVLTVVVLSSGSVLVGPQPCDRFVPFEPEQAARMNRQIQAAQNIRSGQRLPLEFSEVMLSSYVHQYTAGSRDLIDGAARLVEPGVVMICGIYPPAGNAPIAAKVRIQANAEEPYQLEGLAVRALDTGSAIGWVAVPNFVVEQLGLMQRAREIMGDNYIVTRIESAGGPLWVMEIQGK
jgi:hypothetical protein